VYVGGEIAARYSSVQYRLSRVLGAGLDVGRLRVRVSDLLLLALVAKLARMGVHEYRFLIREGPFGFDFRGSMWQPAHNVLKGVNPYFPPVDATVYRGNSPLYPPPSFVLALPFAQLGFHSAAVVWSIVLGVAAGGSLWILGVRDWRCYLLLALSQPLIEGLSLGNLSILLMLLAALAWRYRDRPYVTGTAAAVAVALKLFLWPLLVWLALTRRYRAAVVGALGTAFLLLASWAAIGFDGLRDYPKLLSVASRILAERSESVTATVTGLGGSRTLGETVGVLAGAAVLLATAAGGGRRRDSALFVAAVSAALLVTPVAWTHYYALLFVALAVVRPSFSWLWVLPASLRLLDYAQRLHVPPAPHVACCPPPGVVSPSSWIAFHSELPFWYVLGHTVVALVVGLYAVNVARRGTRQVSRLAASTI
jgi:Glycosyltransferase family 87